MSPPTYGSRPWTQQGEGCAFRIREDPEVAVRAALLGRPARAERRTVGTTPAEDHFLFARDLALLDIAGHQGNDFQIDDDFWRSLTN